MLLLCCTKRRLSLELTCFVWLARVQDFDEALKWYTEASKHTEDAKPALERLQQRMGSDGEHQLPTNVTQGAAAAFKERVSEVEGGRGVMYELESPRTNAPTLDVKLDVSDPAEADEIMREIRESGAVTSAAVMEVLERRASKGAKLVDVVMKDKDGNILADKHGQAPSEQGSGDGVPADSDASSSSPKQK